MKKSLAIVRVYPQWFIDDLYLEEDKDKAKVGALTSQDKVLFYCKEHGIYERSVGSHINLSTMEQKRGCPKCSYEKYYKKLDNSRIYPEWFLEDLVYESDKNKACLGTLVTTDYVTFKCDKGHHYIQQVKNHIILSRQERYKNCPLCSPYRSYAEKEIEWFIKDLCFNTEHKRFKEDKFGLFEIDIYIPEKKIGIEYNGSYFHKSLPDDGYIKDKLYHNKKYYACKRLGIRLISIFEPDWTYRKDKIKQYLKDLLLPIENKIYARKCAVKQIDYKIANSMYEQYHLLGKTTVQSVSYGLFYNNELLSCMSFQKGRYTENNKPTWTLTRFVTKSGCSIVGGASKLLSQFEKDFKPDKLLSYSDNDYFSGGLYSKLGFNCFGDTNSPRYYWYLKGVEYNREQCQLKHLSKQYPDLYRESLSIEGSKEDYIMLKVGALKVYRSGHTKWVKKY